MSMSLPSLSAAEWLALKQSNKELLDALRKCVEVVKVWHAADDVWDIYYKHSPEMKPIREAIARAEGK